MSTGPLYEKTAAVDAELADDFAEWLARHSRDVATIHGLQRLESMDRSDGDGQRPVFAWRYSFDSDEALDVFLERETNESYPGARQQFGDAVDIDSRVLRVDPSYTTGAEEPAKCLNCGALLRGQYCGNCGQRASGRLISLWELLRDAIGDLFEFDSRLWRTLIPLLMRPGRLTHDYLAGRRARYMPPFRMYLVLSLIFFLIAFFNPRQELALLFEPETSIEVEAGQPGVDGSADAAKEEDGAENGDAEALADGEPAEDDSGINITLEDNGADENCSFEGYDISDMPRWFRVRFSKDRVVAVCERNFADGGAGFFDKLLDTIPVSLFVLLPLMALAMVFLYPLSRRYYVEHLLFILHFHTFFFLLLTLQILYGRLIAWLSLPDWIGILPIVASSFYYPVYLFKSMRLVYGQVWLLTFVKYLALVFAYLVGVAVIMAMAFIIALAGS